MISTIQNLSFEQMDFPEPPALGFYWQTDFPEPPALGFYWTAVRETFWDQLGPYHPVRVLIRKVKVVQLLGRAHKVDWCGAWARRRISKLPRLLSPAQLWVSREALVAELARRLCEPTGVDGFGTVGGSAYNGSHGIGGRKP